MTIKEVMADPSVHFFCKRILTQCLEGGDPVDILHDLELATKTWESHVDAILEGKE